MLFCVCVCGMFCHPAEANHAPSILVVVVVIAGLALLRFVLSGHRSHIEIRSGLHTHYTQIQFGEMAFLVVFIRVSLPAVGR